MRVYFSSDALSVRVSSPSDHFGVLSSCAGGQSATAGMLPPSDSEEEEEEEGVEKPKPKPAPIAAASKDKEESEEEESEEESSSDDEPVNDYLSAPRQPKK